MQRAGLAAAQRFVDSFLPSDSTHFPYRDICGTSDNGGDAFEMAFHPSLSHQEVDISIIRDPQQVSYPLTPWPACPCQSEQNQLAFNSR